MYKLISLLNRKITTNYLLTAFSLLIADNNFGQNPDQSVINLWTKKDLKFDSPKTGNPLLPGY